MVDNEVGNGWVERWSALCGCFMHKCGEVACLGPSAVVCSQWSWMVVLSFLGASLSSVGVPHALKSDQG